MHEAPSDPSTFTLKPDLFTSLEPLAPVGSPSASDEIAKRAAQPVPLALRLATIAAVVIPPLVVIATMVLAWGGWFSWVDLVLFGVMYVITGLGITVG